MTTIRKPNFFERAFAFILCTFLMTLAMVAYTIAQCFLFTLTNILKLVFYVKQTIYVRKRIRH